MTFILKACVAQLAAEFAREQLFGVVLLHVRLVFEGSRKRLSTLLAVKGHDAVVFHVHVLHQRVFAVECALALVALVASDKNSQTSVPHYIYYRQSVYRGLLKNTIEKSVYRGLLRNHRCSTVTACGASDYPTLAKKEKKS